jgi:hypothetical protein
MKKTTSLTRTYEIIVQRGEQSSVDKALNDAGAQNIEWNEIGSRVRCDLTSSALAEIGHLGAKLA